MSEEKRNRKLVFITGLSLGLVLGGAIIFFSQNTQIIKYPIEVSQNTIENIVERVTGNISAKQDSINQANKKIFYKKNDKSKLFNKTDSIKSEDVLGDSLIYSIDSMQTDDDILVKKDELLAVKNLEAINFSSIENKVDKDSVLQVASGIQIEKKSGKKVIVNTEYWKSPINYRGYKFIKNKLIVFGVEPQDNISLIIFEDVFYLKAINGIYKLTITEEFRSFERINNSTVAALFD